MARGTKKRYFKKNKTRNNKKIRKQRRMKHSNKSIKRKQIKKSRKRKAVGGITQQEFEDNMRAITEMSPAGRARGRALPPRDFSRMTSASEREGAKAKSLSFAELQAAAREALKEEEEETAAAYATEQSKRIADQMNPGKRTMKISDSIWTSNNPMSNVSVPQRPPPRSTFSEFWDTKNSRAVGDP